MWRAAREDIFYGKKIYNPPPLNKILALFIITNKAMISLLIKTLTRCYMCNDIDSFFYNPEGTHFIIMGFISSFPAKKEVDPFITKKWLKKVAFQWDLIKLELKGNPPLSFPFHGFKFLYFSFKKKRIANICSFFFFKYGRPTMHLQWEQFQKQLGTKVGNQGAWFYLKRY